MWFTGADDTDTSVGYAIFQVSSLIPIAYNETFVNGTDYASVYDAMLSVTVNGYNDMPLDVAFKYGNETIIANIFPEDNGSTVFCNLSEFYQPYPWLDHDATYYWYVSVSDAYVTNDSSIWSFNTSKAWDLNEDGRVSITDASMLVNHFGISGLVPGQEPSDINEDGRVSITDASMFVNHFGERYI
jgi:hypothetical protein